MRYKVATFLCLILCASLAMGGDGGENGAVRSAHRSLVAVKARMGTDKADGAERWYANTGFIVGEEGEVITSLLAVSCMEEIKIIDMDGRQFEAQLKAFHQPTGLAVLETNVERKGLSLANERAELGDKVILASVRPSGIPDVGLALRPSIISSAKAEVRCYGVHHTDLMVIDLECPTGAASAPVLNQNGEIVGVILSGMRTKKGPPCCYVIGSERMGNALDHMRKGQNRRVGWLGMAITQASESPGVVVGGVLAQSPAHRNGIRLGDVMLTANGKKIKHVEDFTSLVTNIRPGDTLLLQVRRQSERKSLKVEVGERPLKICRVKMEEPCHKQSAREQLNSSGSLQKQLEERALLKKLEQLRRRIDALEQEIEQKQ